MLLHICVFSYVRYLFYTDTDTLYSRIYESTEESDSFSALWRYQTRLSLKHLSCSAQTKSHKILNKFLEQVNDNNIGYLHICYIIVTYI